MSIAKRGTRVPGTVVLGAVSGLLLAFPAFGQGGGDFYANRTINLLVGHAPGGVYDISSRLVAQYLGRFIPGEPTIIVQNLPGGGLNIANQFASGTAEYSDGLTIAVIDRVIPQLAIQGHPNANFDPLEFTWLGSLSSYEDDAYLLLVNDHHEVRSVEDMAGDGPTVILGAGNTSSTNRVFAILAEEVLGLDVEIVSGYGGAAPIFLAMQQDEVDGQIIGYASTRTGQRDLWDSGAVRPLIQFARVERMQDLPEIPTGRELAETDEAVALLEFAELPFFMAMPYAAPAGIPEEQARILQEAFMEMTRDETFLAESERLGLESSPIDGEAILELIRSAAQTPADVIAQYNELVADH